MITLCAYCIHELSLGFGMNPLDMSINNLILDFESLCYYGRI